MLLNAFIDWFKTSWLFINVKNEDFAKIWIWNFYPTPPWRGVLKIWNFQKLVIEHNLLNMIFLSHKKRTKSKIWVLYLKNWASYGNFSASTKGKNLVILKFSNLNISVNFWDFSLNFGMWPLYVYSNKWSLAIWGPKWLLPWFPRGGLKDPPPWDNEIQICRGR